MRFLYRRRDFIISLGGAAAASWPLAARAQQAGKVWRIGVLDTESAELNSANIAAFRRGLRELGYVEGENLLVDYRSADGRNERFAELADELVRSKVDVIVTKGTPAVLAAKHASAIIPIVMTANADPLLVVASLAHPGGNITGLSTLSSDLHAKRLELLREMVPGVARVALLTNFSNPQTLPQWQEIEAAARSLGLQARLLDVRKPAEIEPAFGAAVSQRVGALLVGTDGLMQANRALISELSTKHRLPTMYGIREFVDAGGLIAYGPSYPDLYRRAATYLDRIFKGARPAELPVEQPTKFELIVNLKTAKALGLAIPESILLRADEVIE